MFTSHLFCLLSRDEARSEENPGQNLHDDIQGHRVPQGARELRCTHLQDLPREVGRVETLKPNEVIDREAATLGTAPVPEGSAAGPGHRRHQAHLVVET